MDCDFPDLVNNMAILPRRGIYIGEFYIHDFNRGRGKLLGSYIIKLIVNMEMKRGR
jgi:hypothetical protein